MGEGPLSEEVTEVTIDDANGSNAGLVEARISEDGCSHSETVVLEKSVNEGGDSKCAGDLDKGNQDMRTDKNGASNVDVKVFTHFDELDSSAGLRTLSEEDRATSNFDNLIEQKEEKNVNEGSKISPACGIEWPCQSIKNACSDGWPTLKSSKNSSAHVMSAEEKEFFDAYKLQLRVSEVFRDFFRSKSVVEDSEDEDVNLQDSDEDDSEDDTAEGDGSEECDEVKFFVKTFLEDAELKNYYESNYQDGYFGCLVCGGVKKKTWRRFKGYTGLLQHALTISTTRRQAHRAFAMALCKVFGWDINQFSKNNNILEPLDGSSVKSADIEGESKPLADDSTGVADNVETDDDNRDTCLPNQVSDECTLLKA